MSDVLLVGSHNYEHRTAILLVFPCKLRGLLVVLAACQTNVWLLLLLLLLLYRLCIHRSHGNCFLHRRSSHDCYALSNCRCFVTASRGRQSSICHIRFFRGHSRLLFLLKISRTFSRYDPRLFCVDLPFTTSQRLLTILINRFGNSSVWARCLRFKAGDDPVDDTASPVKEE